MKFLKKIGYGVALLSLVFVPAFVLAQEQGNSPKITNPLGPTTDIPTLLLKILTELSKLGIPVVALAVIYSGFLFVKAQGQPEELTKAKDALLYSLIGGVILLGAVAIANMVIETAKSL